MATQKLNLTRDQLATFLDNHELIKQFERLFQVVDEVSPSSDTQGTAIVAESAQAAANEALAQLIILAHDAAIDSGTADNKAQQALDALDRIANAVEMAALQPAVQNNNSVVTDYIDLPEIGPHITQARRVQWNQDDGTMDVGLYGGSVLQVGQELMFYSKNTSGVLIPNGTPVMFTGTVGASGKLTFGLAVADGSVPADYMMGVTTQDIADNDFGYVTSFGLVRGFNTTGVPYGEVWNDGDLLYFGASAPGTWTKVQPIAPRIDVPVAVVVNAGGGGSGSIFVRMSVAESLARLQDVYISGLANGDLLQYDLAQQRWENVPASTLPVGTATNLAGGAAGSVPYQSAPGTTAFRAIGTAGQVFRVNSGATAPEWVSSAALTKTDDTNVTLTLGGNPTNALLAAASLTLGWTGQLAATRGGTGFGSYVVGDLLYANTTTTLAKLAGVATGNALISGGVGAAPSWGKIGLTTHVSGTLQVANGGTGITSFGAGIATWLGTPSSSNLASAVTDETGSGSLVFATRPSFVSTIGVGGATASASGAGISFPASQSDSTDPNTLDDYEEGDWTPTLSSSGTPPTVSLYANRTGKYVKIGRMVTASCNIRATITAVGTGTPQINGLPFSTLAGLDGVARGLTSIFATQPTYMYVQGTSIICGGAIYGAVAAQYVTFTVTYQV